MQAARPMNGPNSKVINAALNLAIAALREQEERENPQPLTLDELRQIDARAGKKVFPAIAQPAEYKGVIHIWNLVNCIKNFIT